MTLLQAAWLGVCLHTLGGAPAEGQGAPPAIEPGTKLVYRGQVARVNRDRTMCEAEKSFRLSLVALASDAQSVQIGWLVSETGRGAWPWIERAGRFGATRQNEVAVYPADGPSLLYDRGEANSVIGVPLPLVWPERPLTAGRTWRAGQREFRVRGPDTVGSYNVWVIEVVDPLGHEQTWWVDAERPFVVKLERRVFMGRGEEHRLTMQLQSVEQLGAATLQRTRDDFAALERLRGALARERQTESPDFTSAQIAELRRQLPKLRRQWAGGVLEPLIKAARRDFTRQAGRDNDVAALVARFVGRPPGRFEAEGLDEARLSSDELKGRVTILHFWDYRDQPLKAPYGQVGYLDFLNEKHVRRRNPMADASGAEVRIFGVAVRRQLGDATGRRAAIRSVKKLRSFMNLGYPILLDDGRLLKQFGDPQTTGASLPLYVVIGPDGRVVHYHVGYYQVNHDEGLKELDDVIAATARSAR